MKKNILLIAFGLILSLNGICQTLNIAYISVSTFVNDTGFCPATPPETVIFNIYLQTSGYSSNDTLTFKIIYGDGTYQTKPTKLSILANGEMSFSHKYLVSGKFDVTYIVSDQYGNADTIVHPSEVIITHDCSYLEVYTYVDKNSNCKYDAGDVDLTIPFKLYHGNTLIPLDSYYYQYLYSFDVPKGENYTIIIDTAAIKKAGYIPTCPVSGIINFTATGHNEISFGVSCPTTYDLSISSSGNPFKMGNSALLSVGVKDISCYSKTGTYTLNLAPQMSFVYALHPPASGSGQTYLWNYSNLGGIGGGGSSISNMMYVNFDNSVKLGDTLCYSFSVAPTSGDKDTLNNIMNLCYKVLSAWDPNYIDVYPKGKGTEGYIPANTTMVYTIGFQNTGNYPAGHVYILDTLENNLDINTLEILYSNYPMQLYIIDGKILEFDFVNINLPDSGSNQMLSHGFVAYRINQKANLTPLTEIKNKAAIYFDLNPKVLTNRTLNTIENPLSINELGIRNEELGIKIYPNPANSLLVVSYSLLDKSPVNIGIYDVMGREVISQNSEVKSQKKKGEINIDVSGLNNGVYILSLQNEKENFVKKIVISH